MILKNELKSDFTQIPNDLITDRRLAPVAFKIVVYLFSKPSGWKIRRTDVKNAIGIKDNNTYAKYWKQILESGWIKRERERERSG